MVAAAGGQRYPTGWLTGIYSVLELPESVTIAAVDAEDRVALVRQWRYAHLRQGLEPPSGASEKSDRTLFHAAQRELEEETDLRASKWTALGTIQNSNGATTGVAHLFLAEGLTGLLRFSIHPRATFDLRG